MRTGRSQLIASISGLDDSALRARPASGAWTPAELLAHLLSTERIFIDRARRAVEVANYTATPVSNDIREEHLGMAKRMPVPQIVHGLLAQRRDTLHLVESLSAAALARTLSHPVRGRQTVQWQIEHVIEHELEHAAELQVRRETSMEEAAP